jgi:PST family polysaccharide transporter
MPALKRFANLDVTRAVASLVWLGLERLTQIGVAIAISGMLVRYFGPDVFGKWQYANTLLRVLSPVTWVCGAEILVPAIVSSAPCPAAPSHCGSPCRRRRCC